MKSGEVNEGTLTCGIEFASAGCETMPEEGCSLLWEVSVYDHLHLCGPQQQIEKVRVAEPHSTLS